MTTLEGLRRWPRPSACPRCGGMITLSLCFRDGSRTWRCDRCGRLSDARLAARAQAISLAARRRPTP